MKKSGLGKYRHCTNLEAIEVIQKMAGKFSDEQIAATLNRLGLRTGVDNAWNEMRVHSVRHRYQLPAFDPNQCSPNEVTLEQAARRLNMSPPSVRKMIEQKILPGGQIVECAPWRIPVEALDTEPVRKVAANLRIEFASHKVKAAQSSNQSFQRV